MAKRVKVTARIRPDGEPFTVAGQTAKALLMLNQKRNGGVTVHDFPGGLGYRLAAYIHDLIKHHRLGIEIERVSHQGGWHGRWHLRSGIEIVSVDYPSADYQLSEAA